MPTECSTQSLDFGAVEGRRVEAVSRKDILARLRRDHPEPAQREAGEISANAAVLAG
jgi:hypothetical protein